MLSLPPRVDARRVLIAAAALAGLAGSAACSNVGDLFSRASSDTGAWLDSMSARTTGDPPLLFETTGPVELDVDVFGGDITVRVRPDAVGTELRVTRAAGFGRGREAEAVQSLESIEVRADVVVGELGQRLMVRADSLHPEAYQQGVNITIITPEAAGARLLTGRGRIDVRDVGGRVELRSGDGPIRLTTERRLDGPVVLATGEGDIDLRTPLGTTGQLDFVTGAGRVSHTVEQGRMTIGPGTSRRSLDAVVVEASTLFSLRTDSGDIRFGIVSDPNGTGRWILD